MINWEEQFAEEFIDKLINPPMKFIVTDLNSGVAHIWDAKQILEEVNRDRSSEWEDYNQQDLADNWEEVCDNIEYFHIRKV